MGPMGPMPMGMGMGMPGMAGMMPMGVGMGMMPGAGMGMYPGMMGSYGVRPFSYVADERCLDMEGTYPPITLMNRMYGGGYPGYG